MMSVESNADLKVLREKAAKRLRIPVERLTSEIAPMENLYAVCDHTRALMFMLQDGVLPSNAKEGYFARMLSTQGYPCNKRTSSWTHPSRT